MEELVRRVPTKLTLVNSSGTAVSTRKEDDKAIIHIPNKDGIIVAVSLDEVLSNPKLLVSVIGRLIEIAHCYSMGGQLLNKEGVKVYIDKSRLEASFALEQDHEIVSVQPAISVGDAITVTIPNAIAYGIIFTLVGQTLNPTPVNVKTRVTTFDGAVFVDYDYDYSFLVSEAKCKALFPLHRPVSQLTYTQAGGFVRSNDNTRRSMVLPYDMSTSNEADVNGRVTSTTIIITSMGIPPANLVKATVYPIFYGTAYLEILHALATAGVLTPELFHMSMGYALSKNL